MSKILLAEDDEMIAEIYIKKFESAGFEVVNAKTGKEVLKNLDKEKFDLILLDMVLPEMSGMDVLKEVKMSGRYDKNTKIIIFSNISKLDIEKEALENGVDGIIGKNEYSPSDLVIEIERLINQFGEQDKNKERQNNPENNSEDKKRILFIEDEDVFLEMFGKKLRDDGYEVVDAKNGAWGLKEAIENHFDLIITDMTMPAMNGEEIITKLKSDNKTKHIPIIAISASITDEQVNEAKEMGVEEFFLKTRIVPSDLSRMVGKILSKK